MEHLFDGKSLSRSSSSSPTHLSQSTCVDWRVFIASAESSSSTSSGADNSTSTSGFVIREERKDVDGAFDSGDDIHRAFGKCTTVEGGLIPEAGLSPTSRSLSLASLSTDCSAESHLLEQEDIVALSTSVRSFKDALGRFRKLFTPEREKTDVFKVAAHEHLGEVLTILKNILEKHSQIRHSELLCAASKLIAQVKGFNYDVKDANFAEFLEAIDHLAIAFSTRVSDYLMGDIDTSSTPLNCSTPSLKTRSGDNLYSDTESEALPDPVIPVDKQPLCIDLSGVVKDETNPSPASDIDDILFRHEQGVELSLHRAKVWSKYMKDIVTFIQKRCELTLEFSKNREELSSIMKPVFSQESYLPLQNILRTAVEYELALATSSANAFASLQGSKFVEPLTLRRNEHEKTRKIIKSTWHLQLKRLNESVRSLKKAKQIYIRLNQDIVKIDETLKRSLSVEELRNLEEKKSDLVQQVHEATRIYAVAVQETNEQHSKLRSVKKQVLQSIRELILQADTILKQVLISYFRIQHEDCVSLPMQYQNLLDASKMHVAGSQYAEFALRMLPFCTTEARGTYATPFEFKAFSNTEPTIIFSQEDLQQATGQETESDTDSIASSRSGKSIEASPTVSPFPEYRSCMVFNISSGEELDVDTDGEMSFSTRRQVPSKAAETHSFRKLKTPSRCRECDSYVYFHGFECSECGLGCHKKCLENLAIQCGHKRLPRKLTTFGIDLQQHLQETKAQVPHLVVKCLKEIDSRGINIKGIYRVSGLKSRVEKLCQAFENGAHLVDLADQHPNVIANVLKLYLRQLPEPLLTFRLYSEFIRVAKDFPLMRSSDSEVVSRQLKDLVKRLPSHHLWCLGVLMLHLNKVSAHACDNNMPPSNLGIVFGPTLLRTSEGSASLSSLVDTVHQTKAIELLVFYAKEIFCSVEAILPKPLQEDPLFYYKQQQQQIQQELCQPCSLKESHDQTITQQSHPVQMPRTLEIATEDGSEQTGESPSTQTSFSSSMSLTSSSSSSSSVGGAWFKVEDDEDDSIKGLTIIRQPSQQFAQVVQPNSWDDNLSSGVSTAAVARGESCRTNKEEQQSDKAKLVERKKCEDERQQPPST